MSRARAETCPHPFKQWETPVLGHLTCKRCGSDITKPGRRFEVRHSERVTLVQGDRIHVKGDGPSRPSFKGKFQWAEEDSAIGTGYWVTEMQLATLGDGKGKQTFEGVAAWRFVHPDRVRRDDGFRQRKKRKEELESPSD